MKSGSVLLAAAGFALVVAVLSFLLGAAQAGTAFGIVALLFSGAGLAVMDQAGHAAVERQCDEGVPFGVAR